MNLLCLIRLVAMEILKAESVRKSYGDLEVLKGIHLTVQKGEVLSIVGESGAGKSTLLHILGTLDLADMGGIMINGKSVGDMNPNRVHFSIS